jgi:hypothetical protein
MEDVLCEEGRKRLGCRGMEARRCPVARRGIHAPLKNNLAGRE